MAGYGDSFGHGKLHLRQRPLLSDECENTMKRALGALLALVAIAIATTAAADGAISRHAYYLFLADAPQGCEDCYIPCSL